MHTADRTHRRQGLLEDFTQPVQDNSGIEPDPLTSLTTIEFDRRQILGAIVGLFLAPSAQAVGGLRIQGELAKELQDLFFFTGENTQYLLAQELAVSFLHKMSLSKLKFASDDEFAKFYGAVQGLRTCPNNQRPSPGLIEILSNISPKALLDNPETHRELEESCFTTGFSTQNGEIIEKTWRNNNTPENLANSIASQANQIAQIWKRIFQAEIDLRRELPNLPSGIANQIIQALDEPGSVRRDDPDRIAYVRNLIADGSRPEALEVWQSIVRKRLTQANEQLSRQQGVQQEYSGSLAIERLPFEELRSEFNKRIFMPNLLELYANEKGRFLAVRLIDEYGFHECPDDYQILKDFNSHGWPLGFDRPSGWIPFEIPPNFSWDTLDFFSVVQKVREGKRPFEESTYFVKFLTNIFQHEDFQDSS